MVRSMKREYANAIRFVMDELVPAAVRDSRMFMKPFFMAAYRTTDVDRFMDFKEHVWTMTEAEYADFYRSLGDSVSRRRETDLNRASIDWILDSVPGGHCEVLDVGCGNGYLLSQIATARPEALLSGVDVMPAADHFPTVKYQEGLLPHLPFPDGHFDVVTCTHVLEHVIDLDASCAELLRVTRGEILIVVPRQRAYTYTLDEHVNFFWQIESLARYFAPNRMRFALLGGDWALRVQAPRSQSR